MFWQASFTDKSAILKLLWLELFKVPAEAKGGNEGFSLRLKTWSRMV